MRKGGQGQCVRDKGPTVPGDEEAARVIADNDAVVVASQIEKELAEGSVMEDVVGDHAVSRPS